ncbi:cytochrome P450, family 71, subfamily A, polypeptide 14 [Arabidopsis thaliana]|uniref:Cytochrome P450, family 71, subfamily A, polypeptide 14 n=1 Tax=Arabidopsis thaliana TaxID=3702 RepID=A0A1P8BF27_ARATH|nr:cytochrome P450, family 71, subfamily A, polypeptide 14 [Arabidopsis thaliana]ANM70199.1 cytochrome P450, family 71, subfamily A, polypeptide 14 [Arabidopsis thaliana]|eukprot:NP_001331829.1 cytochrome P450, family 71, subfamily A, polypeptide 14 [Arabidopsis thaliana]
MEMIIISLCLATILALLLLKQFLNRTYTAKVNLPPSPWRVPVIGNLHQLSLHPHRSLRSLSHRYGPLMLLHFGRVPVLVVSSSDVAHDLMKTHDLKVANRPQLKVVEKIFNGGREMVFSPYGEYWRQIKSVCIVNLLNKKKVQSFEKVREEEISEMMERVEKASSDSSPLNLSELLLTLTSDVTSRVSLGRKYSKEESMSDFKIQMRKITELVGGFPVGEYIPCLAWIDKLRGVDEKAEEVSKAFGDLMEKVLQEHLDATDKPTLDFVDVLLSLERHERNGVQIRRSDIKFLILDMFLAGTETTYALLEWIMTELIRHPECMKKLQDEIRAKATKLILYISEEDVEDMKYLKAVVKEVLRLHPPLPLLVPRELSEDIKLKGYDIAAGTQVICFVLLLCSF